MKGKGGGGDGIRQQLSHLHVHTICKIIAIPNFAISLSSTCAVKLAVAGVDVPCEGSRTFGRLRR